MLNIQNFLARRECQAAVVSLAGMLALGGPAPALAGPAETRIVAGCAAKYPDATGIATCAAGLLTVREAQKCIDSNFSDCFGENNEVRKTLDTIGNDIKNGPGTGHDIVGCKGWLRTRLGVGC